MYPGMMGWWKAQRANHCGSERACHPGGGEGGWHGHFAAGGHDSGDPGGAFGVRRPLRFLAYKLELNDKQVAELARILDDLKVERAQAAVDDRRTTAAFADAMTAAAFDAEVVEKAAAQRVQSAERLKAAVTKALARIHALLDGEQREGFAYLVRTGALTI